MEGARGASVPDREFELELTVATPDWMHTRVGFRLEDRGGTTWVRFSHRGWPAADEHYRIFVTLLGPLPADPAPVSRTR